MIVARLCRECKTVSEYKINDHWEKSDCPRCGSKEISLREIAEGRTDLISKFYKEE